MNRLKLLRTKANLTLRDLEKYVDMRNATLSAIENGKQPFREEHILKLTSFFDVTSDYLLGYANTGIGIYFDSSKDDEDHALISASELEKLSERYEIKETLLRNSRENLTIRTPTQVHRVFRNEYSIYREVNISKEDACISASLREQVNAEIARLDTRDLEKVLKFIRDYIL